MGSQGEENLGTVQTLCAQVATVLDCVTCPHSSPVRHALDCALNRQGGLQTRLRSRLFGGGPPNIGRLKILAKLREEPESEGRLISRCRSTGAKFMMARRRRAHARR